MPVYDYPCLDCQKPFELVLTLKDHDAETVKVPEVRQHHRRARGRTILRRYRQEELRGLRAQRQGARCSGRGVQSLCASSSFD